MRTQVVSLCLNSDHTLFRFQVSKNHIGVPVADVLADLLSRNTARRKEIGVRDKLLTEEDITKPSNAIIGTNIDSNNTNQGYLHVFYLCKYATEN